MLSARAFLLAGLVALAGVLALWAPSPPLQLFSRLLLVATLLAFVIDGSLAARWRLNGRLSETALLPLGREVRVPIEIELTPHAPATIALRGVLPAGLDTSADLQIHHHPGDRALGIAVPVRAVALGEYRDLRLPARVLGPLGLT